MRPTYETERDLMRERALAEKCSAMWKCSVTKLPKVYRLDYGCFRSENIIAWLELKSRTYTSDKYPNYMVSLGKYMAGLNLSHITHHPFILVIHLDDCDMWTNCSKTNGVTFKFFGRHDRGDPQDSEPMAMIPMHNFKRF